MLGLVDFAVGTLVDQRDDLVVLAHDTPKPDIVLLRLMTSGRLRHHGVRFREELSVALRRQLNGIHHFFINL
jgi:hypothetical protein